METTTRKNLHNPECPGQPPNVDRGEQESPGEEPSAKDHGPTWRRYFVPFMMWATFGSRYVCWPEAAHLTLGHQLMLASPWQLKCTSIWTMRESE